MTLVAEKGPGTEAGAKPADETAAEAERQLTGHDPTVVQQASIPAISWTAKEAVPEKDLSGAFIALPPIAFVLSQEKQ